MLGLRRVRFVDIGTGLSMMFGTAGMLVAGALNAAEMQCTPAPGYASGVPVCNDQIFADAAARLRGLYAGLQGDGGSGPALPAPACGVGGCSSDGEGSGEETPKCWTLVDLFEDDCGNNHLTDNGYNIGGSLAQSYTWNWQNPSNGWNGPVTWTDQANQYQLNQLWMFAEKATDTSKNDWDIGGRVDLLFGTNARLATSTGLETPNLNGPGTYGLAIPSLYAEVAYKKLKVKAGHFVSPVGYFTIDTSQNFFNTIPYTYQWGEPFTHTGVVATYEFSENFIASSGYIQGWDNFDGHNPHMGYLGTWAYTFQDKSSLSHAVFLTQEPNFNFEFTQRYYQSVVYSKPINEKWTYVGQTDFGTQRDATIKGERANWYGIDQYLYYKVNEKWTWGVNFEWWRDEEGYRVAQFLPSNLPSGITGNPNGTTNLPGGYQGDFYQLTVGPRWYPKGTPNLFVRPNLRFDWFDGNINRDVNPAGLAPYDAGTKNNQGLFVTDVVWIF